MTSTFFQRLLIIILLAGTVPTLWAQEYKYEIGGMAGGAFYMGDANKNTIFKGMNPAVGAVFRYNINFRWALKANLMWGQVSGKTEGMENVFPNNAQTSFNRSIMELGGQAEFNFFPYSDKFDYAGRSVSLLMSWWALADGGSGWWEDFRQPEYSFRRGHEI